MARKLTVFRRLFIKAMGATTSGHQGGKIQKMDNLRSGARNDEPRPEFIAADAVPPTGF